ncbi:polysaccharide deacetylase family protein [Parasphingorhabdus sp.]|uniref:polysaccharide deacetylase family protein n=1 Tax=Parasphingorhabdus sp. TaxID=2709688 RepID=UPI0035930E7D
MAFSFDDVPRSKGAFLEPDERPRLLIEALQTAGIKQAAFFINPGRITAHDNDAADIAAYARAGHVLANHTAQHSRLSAISASAFLADIDAAETWLKNRPNYRPWFRFPFLDEGQKDKVKRDAVRAGLGKRGLINGYVTVDASDWYMEDQAIAAAASGKLMDWNALRDLFVESYVESANFSDDLARRTLGRAPVQMVLLHETDIAAMFVDDLAAALKADGWTIVTVDEAYRDPIAQMVPDVEFADGTRTQMLAAERAIGNRWYERNDRKVAKKLFAERVLRD